MAENSIIDKGRRLMTTKANLVWAVPIVLYLITQTTLAVWWASSTTTHLINMQADFTEFVDKSNAENLRQWARINSNEDHIELVDSGVLVTNANLDNLAENLERLEAQALETNRLLREILTNNISFNSAE